MTFNFTDAGFYGTGSYYGTSFGSGSVTNYPEYNKSVFEGQIDYQNTVNVTYNNYDALDASVEMAAEDLLDLIRDGHEDDAIEAYNTLLKNVIDSNLVDVEALNIDETQPLSENRNLVALVRSKILTPMLNEEGGRYNFNGSLDKFIKKHCASSSNPFRFDKNSEEDLLRLIDGKTAPDKPIQSIATHLAPVGVGAAIGSIIPGVGTLVGAGIGLAVEGIAALIRKIF